MQPHKLQLKIFTDAAEGVSPEAFISVFHEWIKHRRLPELMVDVANYAHVPKGPGVVLIGHASDYFVDQADGRLGLLHSRKRAAPAAADRLSDVFQRALHAAALLEGDAGLAARGAVLRFRTNELLFRVNDRLAAPNNDATFAALAPELKALAAKLFGAAPFELTRVGDAKGLFSVKLVSPVKADLATLLGRLGGPPGPDASLRSA
jgi:hypothetical protein